MRFTKMQAAGNDYVYMDTLKAPISSPEALARMSAVSAIGTLA